MLTIVPVFTFVITPVVPGEATVPFHLPSFECSRILAIFHLELPVAIEKVVLEESIVFDAVRKCIVSFTMLFSVQKLTSVNRAIFPDLLALSVRQITQPFASVGVFLGFVYDGASSFGNVVSDLPFVVTASAENEPALSVSKPVGKGPYIVASIFKE
jgi:hypothetical protein